MKVVNLFGGPGTGKSTTASDLYALMKWNNINVELVDEYAKELSWEQRNSALQDQLYVVAKQHRKLWRLKGKVDYVITDSPLIMALPYAAPDYLPKNFANLVHECWNQYDNINIFLNRVKPFHQIGRHHTEDESKELDVVIKNLLDTHGYPYYNLDANEVAKNNILNIIRKSDDSTTSI